MKYLAVLTVLLSGCTTIEVYDNQGDVVIDASKNIPISTEAGL